MRKPGAIFTASPKLEMDKTGIRREFWERRNRLDRGSIDELQRRLIANLDGIDFPSVQVLHRYLADPRGGEPDPGPVAGHLASLNPGMVQVLPRVVDGNPRMQSVLFDDKTELMENRWGIPEPSNGVTVEHQSIDLVLVPLLAFDREGHRVGHGKGYYDAFLKTCRRDCLKVGLSLFEPVDRIEDAGDHDVRLDLCITPYRVYEFH
jgi:5-formyltetrahydrofolate cyclo-ligase